jgi:hypothetical protein
MADVRAAKDAKKAAAAKARKADTPGDRPVGRAQWVSDSQVKACTRCQAPFTFVRRRHHCRVCGLIFCNSCTSGYVGAGVLLCAPCAVCQCRTTSPGALRKVGAAPQLLLVLSCRCLLLLLLTFQNLPGPPGVLGVCGPPVLRRVAFSCRPRCTEPGRVLASTGWRLCVGVQRPWQVLRR